MIRHSSARDLRPSTPDTQGADGADVPDPPPRFLGLRRQSIVVVPHAIKCLCSRRIAVKGGADTSLCPMHALDYISELPIDRPKLACIPPAASIKSLPPFVVGEDVVLLGGLPEVASPPKSPLRKSHPFEQLRARVTIVSDDTYGTDGTFSVRSTDGVVYHGISSMRLESLNKGPADVTPRFVDKLILKMGRNGAELNVRELSIAPSTELPLQQLDTMLQQYSKLIRLKYLSPVNMATVLARRSSLYAALGQYDASLADANAAITLEPSLTNGYYRKGVALASLGEFPDACVAFRQGLGIDGSCVHLRHALQVAMQNFNQHRHDVE
ncbi:hypothetical protein ACHHYP_14863 [Achlya hypogyna]|uniref:Uncharacterized protein n=1 Tax=Achlya hypogyna TaxID=1202772 RepID=A0A1V9YC90_ACHHY|nr:hypothetical protein ACHHYP_14863 [Achlya hypogyna]